MIIFAQGTRDKTMEYRIDVTQLQVLPDGNLPSGYYMYRVEAILSSGEVVDLANALYVFAKYRWNTIAIFWDEVPGAEAYRVYRRREGIDRGEGSLLIPPSSYFFDNGLIEFY